MAVKRKLIEVSIPLDEINKQSAREKSIRHGHPSTLHLWWSRKPLATSRAVLFAQLVDDPSNDTGAYVSEAIASGYENPNAWAEERVKQERERLFDLIRRMVDWDNLADEGLYEAVRAEIHRSTGGNPPPILDPFAGGGSIPLEAQRLGLDVLASDLNPVSVLINKAMVELPPQFAGGAPVYPGAEATRNDWPRTSGLAEDVRRYGEWLRDEAKRRIGDQYPKATLPDGSEAGVIAWIWARTVVCPNPACGIDMPLVNSWWLGKKKGKESYVVPVVEDGCVRFEIGHDPEAAPRGDADGTMSGRRGAVCVACGVSVATDYIKSEGIAGRIRSVLMATVAEGTRRRIYLAPDPVQVAAAEVERPLDTPNQRIGNDPRALWTPLYGFGTFDSLFTDRQLLALTTFCDLVVEAREHVLSDASVAFKSPEDAARYADAVATYLAFVVSRLTDYSSSITTWASNPQMEILRNTFARQAIPMTWGYAEGNPFAGSSGGLGIMLRAVTRAIDTLPALGAGSAVQADAATRSVAGFAISTDPPYYDNIGYSDLADYFYVWLRRALQGIYPDLLSTMLVPKAEELVANSYRQGGAAKAKMFFESGFEQFFLHARSDASTEYPITVYYAFKQSESDSSGIASTGWETILGSMVRAGWTVTATWPVRSERGGRMLSIGTNALASSVVLALRPRPEDAPVTDRRGFIAAMKGELGPALRELQQGGIAPVDLPQSAIGPGMGVFSRYAKVIESDGSEMSVRSALARINEVLDELLTEQEGDFDPTTRFAIAWYRSNGYDAGAFGDAENLARARATAVSAMERGGILSARAGKVQLYRPTDLPDDYDVTSDQHTSAWEALQHTIRIQESKGIPAAGAFLHDASRRSDGAVDLDLVKELAYLLFQVAEKNGWTKDAISFNGIATSWSELLDSGRTAAPASTAATLDFDGLD